MDKCCGGASYPGTSTGACPLVKWGHLLALLGTSTGAYHLKKALFSLVRQRVVQSTLYIPVLILYSSSCELVNNGPFDCVTWQRETKLSGVYSSGRVVVLIYEIFCGLGFGIRVVRLSLVLCPLPCGGRGMSCPRWRSLARSSGVTRRERRYG